jgi:DNA relaxase NicK
MDPTPYFIMGLLSGIGLTLTIQAYARRKVKRALDQVQQVRGGEAQQAIVEMRRRVEALEQIVTEPQSRLEREIVSLR